MVFSNKLRIFDIKGRWAVGKCFIRLGTLIKYLEYFGGFLNVVSFLSI
jgi:hypothetical protein